MDMNILFLCSANSARSQMAEGLARAILDSNHHISSASYQPAGMNPFAVKVMAEIQIDISHQASRPIDSINLAHIDLIITLGEETVYPILTGLGERWHWSVLDPVGKGETEEQKLQWFREARHIIHKRIQGCLPWLKGEK